MSGRTRIDVPREREDFFDRPVLRRAIPPIAAFSAFVVTGVMGFMYFGRVGAIEAVFWLIDMTSITVYGGGEFLKAYAIVTRVGMVITCMGTHAERTCSKKPASTGPRRSSSRWTIRA